MTGWCRISTLELPRCDMKGQDAEILAEVLSAEYRDARVFDKYASNLIDQKNIRVRALEALISSEAVLQNFGLEEREDQ